MERRGLPPPSLVRPAGLVRLALREAAGLLCPVACVGCGLPDAALCDACVARVGEPPAVRELAPGYPVWAGAEYESVLRRAVLALKNDQRTDLAAALGAVLDRAFDRALSDVPLRSSTVTDLRLAVLPSSRAAYRRRGYRPVDRVLAATRRTAEHPFRLTRQPDDQIGLTIAARRGNLVGSLVASRRVRGGAFLIVDDVVTTGATLLEARRALVAAGAHTVGAVVIAATRRRILAPSQPHSLLSDFSPDAD